MSVSITRDGSVAIVTIDNPPVNAAGHAVRLGLSDAVATCDADPTVTAVVLACAGRTFVAGADIREFGQVPQPPHLPDVVSEIEGASKPWVAAIHGTALGGGLELAMGCHGRVATASARMGLPEVNLGLIPGAGGTVRLPRLVSPVLALTMAAGGKPITAAEALEAGLIDVIAPEGALLAEAVALARAIQAPCPTLSRAAPAPDDAFDGAADKLTARARGQQSITVAVEAIRRALTVPADEALAAERDAFLDLRASPQSAALRHIFFAERATLSDPRVKVAPRPVTRVGVVGGGTMGAGIAAACLLADLPVTMVERDAAAAQAGADRVQGILADSLSRGLLSADRHRDLTDAFATSDRTDALSDVDLVIEAAFEDMTVKKAIFADLDRVTRPDAILATNTSYLDVNDLAAGTADPSRVIGLHFFSPAHIMKLLEIVVPEAVADDVVGTGAALSKRLRKIGVLAGVCDGFIGNRVMSAYRREGDYLLIDGAMPWQVDAAMKDYGFAMGLFEMQDLAGLDIAWAMRKRRAATRDPAERYVTIADQLCEAGRFGRKTGAGWYDHGSGPGKPDRVVEELILAERARLGQEPQSFTNAQIMERILGTMVTEARALLAEGIAQQASDIDVVMVNGYGFPRWRGGPMFASGG